MQTIYEFNLGNEPLEKVAQYKYLGVIFDENLTFEKNASVLAEAAGRALGSIRSKLKYLKECGFQSFNTLFQCGVLPICDYSAGVWGTRKYNKIEQVLYRGARYFLGVHRFAPTEALLGDLGWVSARTRHKEHILKLWNHLCELPSNRLTRKVFNWDLLYSSRRGTWSYSAKNLLIDIGCHESFNVIANCDIDNGKLILSETDGTEWDINRYKSEKLRYYNLYKYSKESEDYLKLNVIKYHRSLLAQFRCGILPLEIELGRFKGLDLCERICPICNNSVEDEIHFLCTCPVYDSYRGKLFQTAQRDEANFSDMDVLDKFVYLMSNQQRNVIKFLSKAMPLRTQHLYNSNS